MRDVLVKELRSYAFNLVGFVFMGLFLVITGVIFTLSNLVSPGSSDYRYTLSSITFIFLFAVPILTMRLLSEERRQKTDQLLLTTPLSLTDIVVGKYLAAVVVFAATLLLTGLYPFFLGRAGLVVASEIAGSFIGFFLLGAAYIAVGLFISSLTDNQVIAAVVTFTALLLLWLVDWLRQVVPSDRGPGIVVCALAAGGLAAWLWLGLRSLRGALIAAAAGGGVLLTAVLLVPTVFDGLLVRLLQWLSLQYRFEEFNRGVLSLSTVVYYLSFSFLLVFFTVRVVEARRWR